MAGRLLLLNLEANLYTSQACGAKKCFIKAAAAGNITTTVNKGSQAGPIRSLLLLDVYGSHWLPLTWEVGQIVGSPTYLPTYLPTNNVLKSPSWFEEVVICEGSEREVDLLGSGHQSIILGLEMSLTLFKPRKR